MKEIKLEELKVIQLDVLQAIHDFCQNNEIIYSLACGTALGAVRHKGYIPWDDDIDIYLLRDDYNKLLQSYPKGGRYQLISMERNGEWDRPYAKAYDSSTVFDENYYCSVKIGVGIDVYPVDYVPEDFDEWKRFDNRRRRWQKYLIMKQIRFNKERPASKNFFILLAKTMLLPFSRRTISKFIDSRIKVYNSIGGQWVFESAQGMIQKNRFNKKVFEQTIPVEFEDRKFMLFKDYDEYLKNGYGDYMKLPPVEKRVAHHSYKAYWK